MNLRRLRPLVVIVSCFVLVPAAGKVSAQSSTNYQVPEYNFGVGAENELTSPSYRGQASAGALGVGNIGSTNYSSIAGSLTPREEYLEMIVNATTINLGTLSTGAASTGTGTFYVRAYTSSGYYVQTISPTPTNGGVSLAPMTSAAASSPGTEQFGINLVANTSPATFGANPVPAPDSTFAYGAAATGYNTTNQFKYNIGDTIATAPKGIGETDYTISYLANISAVSAGGEYTVAHILVVVATY